MLSLRQSTGIITTFSWDFGDGNTSALKNPVHLYSTSGSYTVNFTVTGPGGSDFEAKTNYITVRDATTKIGIYKDGIWYLDLNGNGGTAASTDKGFGFGAPGWIKVTGDWNNDGKNDIGVTNGQQWYLDWNGNGALGFRDRTGHIPSDHPDGPRLSATGAGPVLRISESRTVSSGTWTGTETGFGIPGRTGHIPSDHPDGPRLSATGAGPVLRISELRTVSNGTWTGTETGHGIPGRTGHIPSESPGWTPVVGDWRGTGSSYIGVTNGQQWYLDWNGNGAWDSGTDRSYTFGVPGWTPVVGDWRGSGSSYIGVTNGQQWYLDWNGNGALGFRDGQVIYLRSTRVVISYRRLER